MIFRDLDCVQSQLLIIHEHSNDPHLKFGVLHSLQKKNKKKIGILDYKESKYVLKFRCESLSASHTTHNPNRSLI